MTTNRRAIPLSLLAVPLAVAAYLIQTVPAVGIFLMLLGAVAWPALLVGVALVGTALEAIAGAVSRWWLILPVLALGGYEACALADHAQAWEAQRSVAEVGGDPVRSISLAGRSLVVRSSGDLGSGLVEHYRIDTVFEEAVEEGRPPRYVSYALIPLDRCRGIGTRGRDRMVQVSWFHVDMLGASRLDPGACKLNMDDVPPDAPVTVRESISRDPSGDGRSVMERQLNVSTPEGRRVVLRSRTSRPLSWTPFFFAGCALNSAGPSWDCIVAPMRDTIGDPYGKKMEGRLVRVLGLRARAPGEIPETNPDMLIAAASRRLNIERHRQDEQAASLLDGILSDPSSYVQVGAVETLVASPRVTGPRLERMERFLEDARQIEPVRQAVPAVCDPLSVADSCRFLNASRNVSSIHALVQWRIDPSSLDSVHRRELTKIRHRMSRDAAQARREADRLRMERASTIGAEDLLSRRNRSRRSQQYWPR